MPTKSTKSTNTEEYEELHPEIGKLVFQKIAPLYQNLENKQKNGIFEVFSTILELFPDVKKFTYKHYIVNKKINLLTVSPVKVPSKKMLVMIVLFLFSVSFYYYKNNYAYKFCERTFNIDKSIAQKQYNKVFHLEDSMKLHLKEKERKQKMLQFQKSLIPFQKKDSSWFGLVPKKQSGGEIILSEDEQKEIKKRKDKIKEYENEIMDIEILLEGLEISNKDEYDKTKKAAYKKYQKDLNNYKKNLASCLEESSMDSIFLLGLYCIFLIASIYDSSVFTFIISLIPYGDILLKHKTDRFMVWFFSLIFLHFDGHMKILNHVSGLVLRKGVDLADAGQLTNYLTFKNFLMFIGGTYILTWYLSNILFGKLGNFLKIDNTTTNTTTNTRTRRARTPRRNTTRRRVNTVRTPRNRNDGYEGDND